MMHRSIFIVIVVMMTLLLTSCGGGDELIRPLPPPITKYFDIFVESAYFSEGEIAAIHKPPGLPADYFQKGNVLVEVVIDIDYWPPQKLEVDFDGSVPALGFEEIDYKEYPYQSVDGGICAYKQLYILWPHERPPELPYWNISAILVDRNGITHRFPTWEGFTVRVASIPSEFPEANLPYMHKPPDLPADYFDEGNEMVIVSIDVDYWPPQKLEIDFDGSVPILDFQEIDVGKYPYLDQDLFHIGKTLYVLWPYESPPLSHWDISAVLTDRNGATHYYP